VASTGASKKKEIEVKEMTEAEKLEAQKMADLGNALELLGNKSYSCYAK
jgi:hypothetical protein